MKDEGNLLNTPEDIALRARYAELLGYAWSMSGTDRGIFLEPDSDGHRLTEAEFAVEVARLATLDLARTAASGEGVSGTLWEVLIEQVFDTVIIRRDDIHEARANDSATPVDAAALVVDWIVDAA